MKNPKNTMWCQILPPILLGLSISGNSANDIHQSGQSLQSIPNIGQYVTEAHFSENKIHEVRRITFADATNLKVI